MKFMNREKDNLISQLKKLIENDTYWLSYSDQREILLKICQLDEFIESKYNSLKIKTNNE